MITIKTKTSNGYNKYFFILLKLKLHTYNKV